MKSVKELSKEDRDKVYKGQCPCGGKLWQGFFDGAFGPNGKRAGFMGLMCTKCKQIFTS
jgi:hypothetical protein